MEDLDQFFETLRAKAEQIGELQKQFAGDKTAIAELSAELVAAVDAFPPNDSLTKAQRALLLYFKGKGLSCLDSYDKRAEECLSKCLKLNPKHLESWVCLGEVFYQKRDFAQSKRSFECGLENCGPNKELLRSLSMVSRFLGSEEEKQATVTESLGLAKQAVMLDLADGYSWYVLGNAHLTNFFTNAKSVDELEMALKAYNQSETHYPYSNPDLHYNRATAFKFMERYAEAANEFKRANEIDPGLTGLRDADEIVRFLSALTMQINTKCKYRGKKLHGLIKTVPSSLGADCPLTGHGTLTSITELVTGPNPRAVLSCKLMMSMKENQDEVPAVFVAVDHRGNFFCLSIYNGSPQMNALLTNRANVMIQNPVFELREISITRDFFRYPCVRISDPESLVVNNEKISATFAPSVITSKAL